MTTKKFFYILFSFLIFSGKLQAQTNYPTDPDAFQEEFLKRLKSYEQRPGISEFIKEFPTQWQTGTLFRREKQELIKILNVLNKKRIPLPTTQVDIVKILFALKDTASFVQLRPEAYFKLLNDFIRYERLKALPPFLKHFARMIPSGVLFKSTQYQWSITQPRITKLELEEFFDTLSEKKVLGAFAYYDNTDLQYTAKGQTVTLKNIKGKINLNSLYFYIDQADYNWARLKVPETEIYVKLKSFIINLNTPEFKCTNAMFYYPSFLNKTLHGEFAENLRNLHVAPEKSRFPYFKSYDGGIVIENFIPHVRYEGGFSIRGLTKYGSKYVDTVTVRHKVEKDENDDYEDYAVNDEFGDAGDFYDDAEEDTWEDAQEEQEDEPEYYEETFIMEKPASLTIFNLDNRKVLRIEGEEFALNPKNLSAENLKVTVFLKGGDTLFHPRMDLYYDVNTQDMSLSLNRKTKEARHPVLSSYHKFYLYFGGIKWNPNANQIYFTEIIDKEHRKGALESMDFFVRYRFNQFKGILRFNPIGLIYRYYQDAGLSPRDWASITQMLTRYRLQKYEKSFIYALEDMEGSGFVEYDRTYQRIRPTIRLYKWALAAKKKKDFDAIQLVSQVKDGPYAMLDYETKKLFVYGVQPFRFTDSQKVFVFPHKQKIVVGENRNIDFGGVIVAGKINLYARQTGKFHFDYQYFKVVCDSIDSLKFFPDRDPRFKSKAQKRLAKALKKLKLEDISGVLYIDKPWNKSGRVSYDEYPVFDSYKKAYVYWRDSSTQNGIYTADKINFQIDPFLIDTLETFDLSALEFYGEFKCDSIMPSFRDTLKPVADNTYGVHRKLPPEGVPLYGGVGQFYNEVTMDHFGFHGNGKLTFLSTTAESDTFLFHFDSVMAVTRSFRLKGGNFKGASFPEVKAQKLGYKWYPKKQRLEVWTLKEPMYMYGDSVEFYGKLIITPKGAVAQGKMFIRKDVVIESSYISMKEKNLNAVSGTFTVKDTKDTSKVLMIAKQMNVEYSMEEQSANFVTTVPGKPNVEFPQQKFKTTLGTGTYSRKEQSVHLGPHPVYKEENYVESTDPSKHNLKFFTNQLDLDLSDQSIGSKGSDSILVADAIVYPENGKVSITPDGKIAPLENARIKITQKNPDWHEIVNANVTIKSSISYEASGDYVYVLDQKIPLEKIITTTDTVSYATAEIPKEAKFQITERIEFNGNVELLGSRKFLKFDGEVKIRSSNPFLQNTWFTFADVVNPDSIFIPVKNPKNRRGDKLTVGVHYKPPRRLFYSNFLQPVREPKKDLNILLSEGGLTYDRNEKVFKIGPRNKLEQKVYTGNSTSYNDDERIITSYGKFDFPTHFPEGIASMSVAGMFKDDQDDYIQKTDWVLTFNIRRGMPKGAVDGFTKNFKRMVLAFDDINIKDRKFKEAVAELLPVEDKENAMNSLAKKLDKAVLAYTVNIGKELGEPTFAFSNVRFNFDFDTKVFYAYDSVGFISMEGVSINKVVPAKILYSLGYALPNGSSTPDTLRIYLEYDENNWLYFEYADMEVRTVSSYFRYNQAIAEAVKKDEGKTADREKPELFFRECKEEHKDAFLSRMSAYILKR